MEKKCGRSYLNKRGSIIDLFFGVGVILFFVIAALIGFKVVSELDTLFQASDVLPAESKTASTEVTGLFSGVIDNTFLFFVVGLGLSVLILAALVRVHPIFILPFIIVYILLIFFSGVASNIYEEFAQNPAFITQANQLSMMTNLLTYLPLIIGIFGILLMMVTYKMWQVAQ